MKRFKAVLTSGNWPNNPEPLVRDRLGDYVKYTDCVKELMEWKNLGLAKLGATRDNMTTQEIEIIQRFLS